MQDSLILRVGPVVFLYEIDQNKKKGERKEIWVEFCRKVCYTVYRRNTNVLRWWTMENTSFLLIDESVLPEVYQKVIRVNQLLETGEASNTSEAVKMAGISRSVYYKYNTKKETGSIMTVQVVLNDKPGVLVNLLTVFYKANANILTINQNIPVKGKAFVSVSARSENMSIEIDELLKRLFEVQGVIKIDSIVG